MKTLFQIAVLSFISIVIAHFLFQFMADVPQWEVAVERIYVSFTTIVTLVVIYYAVSPKKRRLRVVRRRR